jgi:hypothetical protein
MKGGREVGGDISLEAQVTKSGERLDGGHQRMDSVGPNISVVPAGSMH